MASAREELRQVLAVRLEQRVEQRDRRRRCAAADQRVAPRSAWRGRSAIAGRGGADGQPLVGLGRLDQLAASPGCIAGWRKRVGAVAADPRRDLDDVVGVQLRDARRRCAGRRPGRRRRRRGGERAAARRPRCRRRRRGGSAARAFVSSVGSAYIASSWRSMSMTSSARVVARRSARPAPRRRRSSSAGNRTGPRRGRGSVASGRLSSLAMSAPVARGAPGSRSIPSTRDRRDPAQMVEADMLQLHAIRLDAQAAPRSRRWKLIATLHRPSARWPLIQQRLGDDADRVREVDDPGLRRRPLADQLGELDHHGHRAQRLGEAAGAGRLLADGAELQGAASRREARRLSADRGAGPARSRRRRRRRGRHRSASSGLASRPGASMRWASPPTTCAARRRCRGVRARRSAGGRGGW